MEEIAEEKMPAYPGYKLIYGAFTKLKNYCVAMLARDNDVGALLLKFPMRCAKVGETSFSVVVGLDMCREVMNAGCRFYNLKEKKDMLMATGAQLRYGNVNDWRSGTSSQSVFHLSSIGYGGEAKITVVYVSRTEKSVILAASRYGEERSGSGEDG